MTSQKEISIRTLETPPSKNDTKTVMSSGKTATGKFCRILRCLTPGKAFYLFPKYWASFL